jgi:tripartite-type tricarboxylate transporter receptor subunit TctC
MTKPGSQAWNTHRIAAAALLAAATTFAHAQESYPTRPVKVIVPFPPGSIADLLPRVVTEKLAARWGQPVVIENRPGASGNIGAETVAKAEPDGYTLLASPPPPIAINQSLYPKLGFDPGALVPVTIIGSVPNVLVVNAGVKASSVAELITAARANPDKLSYASTGNGGTPHLTMERLKAVAGVRLVHVPYKGLPPAVTDLLAGRVDAMFLNLADALRHVKPGRLKALAVASGKRVAELPDVPTLSETYSGFVSVTWFAFVAPPGTSPEIAAKLSGAIAETLRLPEVAKSLHELNIDPIGSTPAQSGAFIKEEIDRWHSVIVAAHVQPDD